MTELSKTIGELDTTRRVHGFNSEIGGICSNAIEQLKRLSKETNPAAITALKAFTGDTLIRLRRLIKDDKATHELRAKMAEQRNRQAGEG